MTCKSGTHFTIKRLNSQLHVAEKNNYTLAYAMGEFGQEHTYIYIYIYDDKEKLFQNIKKAGFRGCLHKLSPPQQNQLYHSAALDFFTTYTEAIFYTIMTLFQHLCKKLAENQILRTANSSSESYPH